MRYELAIGDRSYSSWSLRGWLLFAKFGIPVALRSAFIQTPEFERLMAEFRPARLVPALRMPDGVVIGETLAIAETLHERHPGAGLWPADGAARAVARYLAAEMHAGFSALRASCPMNLRIAYEGSEPDAEVLTDLARIEELWRHARARFGGNGPWLFGEYCAADAFYAPVAARIAGYDLPVSAEARAYVAAHLADPDFRRWRAMGLAEPHDQPRYRKPFAQRPWPGPEPRAATLADGPARNTVCPYSGKPVTHFLRLDGTVWGFCNAFCRDKTLADPDAWPDFTRMEAG